MRNVSVVSIVVFTLMLSPAWGKDVSALTPRDKVIKIAEIKYPKKHFSDTVEAVVPLYTKGLLAKNPNLTPQQIARIKAIIMTAFDGNITAWRNQILDAMIKTYAEQEIDALYQFHTSPAGIAIAAKQDALEQSVQSQARTYSQKIFGPETVKVIVSDPLLKDLKF